MNRVPIPYAIPISSKTPRGPYLLSYPLLTQELLMRFSKRLTRTAAVLATLAAVPAMAASGFVAGQWEHQTNLVSANVPGIPQWLIRLTAGHSTRRNCPSQSEAQNHPEVLLQGDDSATCKLRKLSMADGKLEFDTFCTNKHFPDGLLVSSRGSYTPTTYSISTTSTGVKNGKPVRIMTTGTGRRVSGSCDNSK
ncbi:MAG: DUF3617 family protein [Novosphingobium sp.]